MKDLIDAWKKWVNENPTWFLAVIVFVLLFIVGAVLTIRYKEFGEFLKAILSPQIIIGLLVVYFISKFENELSRLIDKIKTLKSSWLGLEIGDTPTPKDKALLPEPAKEVERILAVDKNMLTLGAAAPAQAEQIQNLTDKLKKVQEQAWWWFFKYLCKALPPRTVEILNKLKLRTQSDDLSPEAFAGFASPTLTPGDAAGILDILKQFELIDILEGKISVTETGKSFLAFYFGRAVSADMSDEERRVIGEEKRRRGYMEPVS